MAHIDPRSAKERHSNPLQQCRQSLDSRDSRTDSRDGARQLDASQEPQRQHIVAAVRTMLERLERGQQNRVSASM